MKRRLSAAVLALVALLVAGLSYWAIREGLQPASPPKNLAEAPAPSAESPPATPASPEEPSATAPDQPTGSAGSNESSAPISPPQPSPAPGPTVSPSPQQPSQVASPAQPPAQVVEAPIPSEDKMSAANRRQIQEALHRLGYYDGPVDGIFGPLTRAAIRRFQDSIGEKGTGRLTAAQARRLVSTS